MDAEVLEASDRKFVADQARVILEHVGGDSPLDPQFIFRHALAVLQIVAPHATGREHDPIA